MDSMSFAQIKEKLNNEDLSSLKPLNIVILRNITIEPIEFYLRYLAYEIGFNAKVVFGEYDNIYQESVDNQRQIIDEGINYIFIFMQLRTLSPDLTDNFTSLTNEDIKKETLHIKEYVGSILKNIRKKTDAVILWHSFELPIYPAMGIFDYQKDDGQNETIMDLNRFLKNFIKDIGNTYFVDMNLCVSRLGTSEFYDKRYWHIAKSPYSRHALAEVAKEDFKFIRALKGKNKKCLVLDCDNILWGGIIGEDSLAGIKLGKTYPGSIYYELQNRILNLYHKGIILALCSKNNEKDVWEVFQNHPDMILKEKHIAAFQINWKDKASNIRHIAEFLNIGLDSIVFIDDSYFEINLVQQVLPDVNTIHFSKEKAVNYSDIIDSCGLFDTLSFSLEDKERGKMYRVAVERKKLADEIVDIDTYYKSLEMAVNIALADDFSIPRIAQLTQKTNQFNLTTKRYSQTDIEKMTDNQSYDAIYLRVQDRFGDMGIVGVCIITYEEDIAIFDSFLLSCRILGRKVEEVFLQYCLKRAKERGAKSAIGEYLSTNKNMQVKDFYKKRGFEVIDDDEAKCVYRLDLTDLKLEIPNVFKNIVVKFGSDS